MNCLLSKEKTWFKRDYDFKISAKLEELEFLESKEKTWFKRDYDSFNLFAVLIKFNLSKEKTWFKRDYDDLILSFITIFSGSIQRKDLI